MLLSRAESKSELESLACVLYRGLSEGDGGCGIDRLSWLLEGSAGGIITGSGCNLVHDESLDWESVGETSVGDEDSLGPETVDADDDDINAGEEGWDVAPDG